MRPCRTRGTWDAVRASRWRLGSSAGHTNRTLQGLRGDGLITLRGGELKVHRLEVLMNEGLFSDSYLHLDHEGAAFDANA